MGAAHDRGSDKSTISIFVVLMSGQLVPLNKFVAFWVVLAKEEILLHPSFLYAILKSGGKQFRSSGLQDQYVPCSGHVEISTIPQLGGFNSDTDLLSQRTVDLGATFSLISFQ